MPLILGLTLAFVVLLFIAAGLTATLSAVLKVTDSKARILVGEGFAGADALDALRTGEAATSPLVILRAVCNLPAAGAGTPFFAGIGDGREFAGRDAGAGSA